MKLKRLTLLILSILVFALMVGCTTLQVPQSTTREVPPASQPTATPVPLPDVEVTVKVGEHPEFMASPQLLVEGPLKPQLDVEGNWVKLPDLFVSTPDEGTPKIFSEWEYYVETEDMDGGGYCEVNFKITNDQRGLAAWVALWGYEDCERQLEPRIALTIVPKYCDGEKISIICTYEDLSLLVETRNERRIITYSFPNSVTHSGRRLLDETLSFFGGEPTTGELHPGVSYRVIIEE